MFSSKFHHKNENSHKYSVSSYYGDSVTNMLTNWLKDDSGSDNTQDYLIFDTRKSSTRSNGFSANFEKPVHWVIGK
uniref:Uncharacterized protein n=1 Tax=Panagrolaimus superbus TaxID=310955 RepID=A0A914YYH5_9BILA